MQRSWAVIVWRVWKVGQRWEGLEMKGMVTRGRKRGLEEEWWQ